MDKEEIKQGILHLLTQSNSSIGDGMGYTLLEIKDFLKFNNVSEYSESDKESWEKIKDLLNEMEEEDLIEERHFGEILSGRVDYSIENKGLQLIKNKDKILKTKWKLSE